MSFGLLSLFYSNKDIILNMEKLKNSVIFCRKPTCNEICTRDSLSFCTDCNDYYCSLHTVETKCCGTILCTECVISCNSDKYNGYYCQDCLVDEYNQDTNQVAFSFIIAQGN